jgi:hypothetical protein
LERKAITSYQLIINYHTITGIIEFCESSRYATQPQRALRSIFMPRCSSLLVVARFDAGKRNKRNTASHIEVWQNGKID